AEETVQQLHRVGLRIAILTRNTRESVERAFGNFEHLRSDWFELVITRDEGEPLKPHPGSVLEVARRLGVEAERLLMVGDYRHDIEAGAGAGSWTALIRGDETKPWMEEISPDYVVRSLGELPGILSWHRPLETGKLPNDMLASLLDEVSASEDVVIGPGVGEDVAAVCLDGSEMLLAKSDPITFPTDHIGRYAITINANDVVCSGALPRWFLATAIFPPETTGHVIREVFREMLATAAELDIRVVGGHTEISDAVCRPVVSGALFGSGTADNLLNKRNIRPDDRILMTKRPGVEGTAIIAAEFPELLSSKAVSPAVIESALRFTERLAILPEARLAADSGLAVALHDVTEGGVATALEELARAAEVGIEVEMDGLAPYPETGTLCSALGVDPLGLIGSGSLIIAVRPEGAARLLELLTEAGIDAREIGRAIEVNAGRGGGEAPAGGGRSAGAGSRGARVTGLRDSRPVPFPRFEVDELARLYREAPTLR
ncbi:MAG: HAD-IA family hydrolase, partial [Spirochaetes bacterium]|nr:HAD-IA family hydrolase [Spirochaetota bacterium]